MNPVPVRCWRVENYRQGAMQPDQLFITYPEDNSGHDLITCLRCGQIYAITIAKEVYVGPSRSLKLRDQRCVACGVSLATNFAAYPETYVVGGETFHYVRDRVLPNDAESIVREFPGIYE